jgi:hypothetical protein
VLKGKFVHEQGTITAKLVIVSGKSYSLRAFSLFDVLSVYKKYDN